jgi:hypothetical protein
MKNEYSQMKSTDFLLLQLLKNIQIIEQAFSLCIVTAGLYISIETLKVRTLLLYVHVNAN